MIDKPVASRPAIEVRIKSPLDEELGRIEKTHRLFQKYNLKRPKDRKMPEMIFEGEDRS